VKTILWKARPHPGPLLGGEGETSAANPKIPATELAGHSSAIQKASDGFSFSLGEKVRMRASHPLLRILQLAFPANSAIMEFVRR
jgi:hypothetical protein